MASEPATSGYALARADAGDVPYILLPYQQEAITLSHRFALYVCEKSRRTGLTYGFAADAVLTAAATKSAGGMDFFYIAYNLDMTREFIGYCGEFAKAFDTVAEVAAEFLFDDGSEEGIKAFRIEFPSGFSIVALSSKPRSLRGKQGVVLIDEAAFHDSLEELLKAALALLMWGGRVIVISTHDGADNAFNELIEAIRAGKRAGVVHRITLTEALDMGLYKRICLVSGKTWSQEAQDTWEAELRAFYGEAAEEELDVVPARGSGTYLPRATIKAAMSDALPVVRLRCPDGFELKDDWERDAFVETWLEEHVGPLLEHFDPTLPVYFGQDFARTGDVSPIAFGQEERSLLIARFILEMRNVPFRQQEQVLNWILDRVAVFGAGKMDGRGNGSALAEFAQQRWGADRIEAVMASDKVYLDLMPRLRARIEDRTIQIPEDEGTIEDLRMIKLVRGVPKIPDRSIMSKADGSKGKRHGDNAIALMHLVAAADEDVMPIDLDSTGERRASAAEMEITNRGFGSVRVRDSRELYG